MNEGFGSLDAAFAAARWGWYLAAFLLLGAGGYAPFFVRLRGGQTVSHPGLAEAVSLRSARIGVRSALALLLLAALRLWLQSRTLIDPGEPVTRDLVQAVLGSTWGHGWLRQVAMALVAVLAFRAARAGGALAWMIATLAGAGLALTSGMTGHAATEKAGLTGLLLDGAHLWAGGLWLGGLALLLTAGLDAAATLPEEARPEAVRALVADFSRRALVAAPLTVVLGSALAVRYLGWGWPLELTGSGYGRTLLTKLAALLLVAGIGAWNWRVVQPTIAAPGGVDRLRRTAAAELLFGVLLLAFTALLVALPMPGEEM